MSNLKDLIIKSVKVHGDNLWSKLDLILDLSKEVNYQKAEVIVNLLSVVFYLLDQEDQGRELFLGVCYDLRDNGGDIDDQTFILNLGPIWEEYLSANIRSSDLELFDVKNNNGNIRLSLKRINTVRLPIILNPTEFTVIQTKDGKFYWTPYKMSDLRRVGETSYKVKILNLGNRNLTSKVPKECFTEDEGVVEMDNILKTRLVEHE